MDSNVLKFKFRDGEVREIKYVNENDSIEFHKELHKEVYNDKTYYCIDTSDLTDKIIAKYNMTEWEKDNSFVLVEDKYVIDMFIEKKLEKEFELYEIEAAKKFAIENKLYLTITLPRAKEGRGFIWCKDFTREEQRYLATDILYNYEGQEIFNNFRFGFDYSERSKVKKYRGGVTISKLIDDIMGMEDIGYSLCSYEVKDNEETVNISFRRKK